jgi:hypothetical protein
VPDKCSVTLDPGRNIHKLKELPTGCRAGDKPTHFLEDFACGKTRLSGKIPQVQNVVRINKSGPGLGRNETKASQV